MLLRHKSALAITLLLLLSFAQAHPLFSFWNHLAGSGTQDSATIDRHHDEASSSGQLVFRNNPHNNKPRTKGRTEFDNVYAAKGIHHTSYSTSNNEIKPHKIPTVMAGDSRPAQTFHLRHMLHHGGHQYPKLFRRKDIQPQDRLKSEMLTGESLSHQINVRATTTLKPRDRSFRSQGFRALGRDQSIAPGSWTKEVIDAPDVMEKDTLIQLAKLNYNSYSEANDGGWYDLEGKWSVNSTFGWEEDGVRGHVFASDDNSTLIMAIKGTTAGFFGGGGSTVIKDKLNDNLLFSCCCGKLDWSMRTVCGCHMGGYRCDQICVEDSVNTDDVYYNIAMKILWNVQDMYPDADVWLTGHSLGGGLSSLLAQTFGVPAITFEIPGDRLAAQRLHLPGPPAIQWEDFPLYHVGHTADPVFQGTCTGVGSCRLYGIAMESKCHTGRTCVYDPVTEDGWSADIRKHRLKDTIEGVLMRKEVPKCLVETGCVDCGRWEYVE